MTATKKTAAKPVAKKTAPAKPKPVEAEKDLAHADDFGFNKYDRPAV